LAAPGFRPGSQGFAWIRGFNLLGFPWILSSGLGLFKGLRDLNAGKNFMRPSAAIHPTSICQFPGPSRGRRAAGFHPMLVMKAIIADILVFSKRLLSTEIAIDSS
jgi:hypothetical protein